MTSITEGLNDLKMVTERLEELAEWADLTEQESLTSTLPWRLADPCISEDLRGVYGLFCQLDGVIRQAMQRPELVPSEEDRQAWMERLAELEGRVRRLRLRERFINR